MTERLSQLLASEADGLDVPPPSVGTVLRQGHGMRRRRTLVAAAAGAAAVLVVGGTAVALSTGGGDDDAPDPAGPPPLHGAVYAVGNEVFLDDGATQVTIQDKAVKSLYYTSAGVLVRQGDNPGSDGGGQQRFSLVSPDGELTDVGVETEETVHATDPDQPYVAYAQAVDGRLVVIVHDVVADERVAEVEVGPTEEGWFPVSLDGDTVYVQDGYGGATYAVDWRAGAVEETDVVEHALYVAGGKAVVSDGDGAERVVDATSGKVLLEVPTDEEAWTELSPDGRFAEVTTEDWETGAPPVTEVYDLATGSHVTLEDGSPGWTPDGRVFTISDEGVLRTCDPVTGDCTTSEVQLPEAPSEDCTLGDAVAVDEEGNVVGTESGGTCEGGSTDIVLGGTIRES